MTKRIASAAKGTTALNHVHRGSLAANALLSAIALLALSSAEPACADNSATIGDLKQLNLEDLMNVEVTSVARHAQKLLGAASAIQVITQEEIRRSGATSIPEALRLADNLQVAQKNSHDWAISARGFNTALANKLLVLIDGRTVYTPLYSGVFWDVQDTLLEDIDRIEVISGPGGALWGANAVNGVINIITKSAADTQGVYAEGAGGSQPQAFAGVRYGGSLGVDTRFRVYGKYVDQNAQVLSNSDSAGDGWHQARTGFRLDSALSGKDKLTFQGDLYQGREDMPSLAAADTSGENLLGRWSRTVSADCDFSLQSYLDQTHLADPTAPLSLGGHVLTPAGTFYDDLTTYDIDFQERLRLNARQQIVWGLGYRHTHDSVINAPSLGFLPATLNQSLYSAFIQDEIAVSDRVGFTAGTKLEHNDYTGFEVEPSLRLSWALSGSQALWSAVSRAVRTPSRIDHDLTEGTPPYFQLLKGGADFEAETVVAYELGYRAQLNSVLSASVSGFYNKYDDVRSTSFTPATILPLFFANNLEGDTDGVELSANYQASESWTLHLGYTLLNEHLRVKPGQTDLNNALNETADPKHQFSLRSSLNLPLHAEWDAALRWVDTLHTNSGPVIGTVPAYFELNTRFAWHASRNLELSLVGENLLHNHHPEYGFPDPSRIEIERSVYGRVTWKY